MREYVDGFNEIQACVVLLIFIGTGCLVAACGLIGACYGELLISRATEFLDEARYFCGACRRRRRLLNFRVGHANRNYTTTGTATASYLTPPPWPLLPSSPSTSMASTTTSADASIMSVVRDWATPYIFQDEPLQGPSIFSYSLTESVALTDTTLGGGTPETEASEDELIFPFSSSTFNSITDAGEIEAPSLDLPIFVYSSKRGDDDDDEEEKLNCVVCQTEFEEGDECRLLPNCLHRFHVQCIDVWLSSHSTCPLCRKGVIPEDP